MYQSKGYVQYQTPEKIKLKFGAIIEPDSFWKDKSIIDVGCCEGLLYPLLKEKGISRYVGIDNSPEYIEKAREWFPDIEFRLGDLRDVHDKFDIAVSFSTLHIFDDKEFEKVIGHYSKICKIFIVEFPVKGTSPIYHTRDEMFVAEVGMRYFKDVFCYGVSPSPHDIQSTRKVFKLER